MRLVYWTAEPWRCGKKLCRPLPGVPRDTMVLLGKAWRNNRESKVCGCVSVSEPFSCFVPSFLSVNDKRNRNVYRLVTYLDWRGIAFPVPLQLFSLLLITVLLKSGNWMRDWLIHRATIYKPLSVRYNTADCEMYLIYKHGPLSIMVIYLTLILPPLPLYSPHLLICLISR